MTPHTDPPFPYSTLFRSSPDQTPRGRDATVALDQRDCRVHPDRLGARHLERPPPALLGRIWREFRSRLADAAALAGLADDSGALQSGAVAALASVDRKSTRLNSSH